MKFDECPYCGEYRWVEISHHGWCCKECEQSLKESDNNASSYERSDKQQSRN